MTAPTTPARSTTPAPHGTFGPMAMHDSGARGLRHLRAPVPLHFPESAEMPESKVHLLVRTFLFQLLRHALGPGHSVGSEQFVYWMPTNPRRCLAPDVFVKLGVDDTLFGTWKCWRHGAPDLAIEVVSPSDSESMPWDEKLARYAELGVAELLRFDPEAREGERMRAWDRIDEDLVEREVDGDRTPCVTLGWTWVVHPVEGRDREAGRGDREARCRGARPRARRRASAIPRGAVRRV